MVTTQEQKVSQSGRAADFSSRAMAFVIDCFFLVFFAAGCCFLLLGTSLLFPPATLQQLLHLLGFVFLLVLFGPLLLIGSYFVVLQSCGGQTLGKIFMGVRVVDKSGCSLTFGASFLRLVGYLLSFLPMGAGFLWMLFDKGKSSWHDTLSDSRVIFLEGEKYLDKVE